MSIDPDDWIENELVVDRSTLERWATCPVQARHLESGLVIDETLPLTVGTEAHDVLSQVTAEYVRRNGGVFTDDLWSICQETIAASRPDVTTRVNQTLKSCLRSWCAFIGDRRPTDLLRFDGGEGEQSGQLAMNFDAPAVQITSEVDLLYAGDSPDILHEVDYKTGFATWTEDDIKHALQFQLHAVLVFENYPECQCLEVIVWDTRTNHRTFRVRFFRRDEALYRGRVLQAARHWMRYRDQPTKSLPTWPEIEKCSACPVAQYCPRCECVETDPVELLRTLVVLDAAKSNVQARIAATVKRTGQDVTTPEGDGFGKNKPPSTRAKINTLYSTKKASDED